MLFIKRKAKICATFCCLINVIHLIQYFKIVALNGAVSRDFYLVLYLLFTGSIFYYSSGLGSSGRFSSKVEQIWYNCFTRFYCKQKNKFKTFLFYFIIIYHLLESEKNVKKMKFVIFLKQVKFLFRMLILCTVVHLGPY